MTERPGRKALFTGAMIPKKTDTGEGTDTEQIAKVSSAAETTLKQALNGSEKLLDPEEFRPEFRPLVSTVNTAAREIISAKSAAQQEPGPVPLPSPGPGLDVTAQIMGSPIPSVLLDPDGIITGLNPEFLRMSGYGSEISGKPADTLSIAYRSGNPVKEALQYKTRAVSEGTAQFPSGSRSLEVFAAPICLNDGTIPGVQVFFVEKPETVVADSGQKDVLEKIEQLKQRAQIIVQENPMPIVLAGTSLAIKVVNDAFVGLTGIPRKELLGKNLREFRILAEDGEDLKIVPATKRRSSGEITVEFAKGIRILKQYGIPILDPAGEVREILVVYNDITEERREMDLIGSLKKRSEAIVRENPFAILLTDSSLRILEANPAFLTLSGFGKDRITGMNLADIRIQAKEGEGVKDAIEKRTRGVGEVTVELPSGTRTLEQYVIPLLEKSGSVEHVLIVYNDITAKRSQDADIRKKIDQIAVLKKRSDVIVQENPMPMMVMDLQFGISLANDAYARMSGIPREKLLEMNAKSFRILDQKGEGLKQVLEQKKRVFGEVTVEFPAGRKTLEQHGLPLFDDKGNLAHILTVYNDVTRAREQETRIAEMVEEAKAGREILTASAGELETAMARVAAGDLTHRVSIDDADPLVRLKKDYNQAIDAIRSALEELETSMVQLETTIPEMTRSTGEILRATEQVADASQKSSDNTSANLASIEKLNADISEISASIEEIASTSQDVMQHAEKAAEEGHIAAGLGQSATAKMQNVEAISQESVADITRLNDQMREINKIVNLIADIASQTNLLALNAAIEAARAGEHGRGFAVVAGEVKSLAGESKNASNQIENLIKAIQKESEKTASSMKDSYSEIKSGIESVTLTIESLNRIVSEAEVVSQGIHQITKATMDQADAANRVMSQTEESKAFTRENLTRLQDMAAMAQETNASTEEIAQGAGSLADMAKRFTTLRRKFKLH